MICGVYIRAKARTYLRAALFAFCSLNQTIYGNVENHLSGWALCRPFDSYINLRLPGTPVPGYRLCRPYGTAGAESLQARCRLMAQSKTSALPGFHHLG